MSRSHESNMQYIQPFRVPRGIEVDEDSLYLYNEVRGFQIRHPHLSFEESLVEVVESKQSLSENFSEQQRSKVEVDIARSSDQPRRITGFRVLAPGVDYKQDFS